MEVRERGHSPPFWASTSSNASNPSPTSPNSNSSSTQSGIKPWIVVLVFSIVVLLFLPTILSSPFRNTRSLSIKSGWDMLNLCLVVFAILCGVLSRTGDGSGPKSGSDKNPHREWAAFSNPTVEVNRTAGIRRMQSSSSYPDLRLETDVWGQNRVPDSWRFFDDAELYRTRRPGQLYQIPGSGEEERECKTIQVDTEMMHPQVEGMEKETNFEEGKLEKETIFEEEKKAREAMVVRRRRRSLEALPKMEEVEKESVVLARRRRRRSLERFPLIEEVEKEKNFVVEEVEEEKVEKQQMGVRRRRKSLENFPKMDEIEKETKVEEEMVGKPPEAVGRSGKQSSEKLPEIEEVANDRNHGENMVEKPPMEVAPPPPPPPLPPPPETKAVEECRNHRSGSGGGAKDLASAIALFYQKKKKGYKSKRKEKQETSIMANPNSNSTTESNNNPSTAPPPPPPPPPASIVYQLLSNKKGGSKSRRIHSLSASTHSHSPSTVNTITMTPPPPPPPPPPPQDGLHRSKKHEISSSGDMRIENTELYVHRRKERSKFSPYANYPLPPRSPLPPAPPPPPPVCENVTQSREEEEQKNNTVAVFGASPDVNDKADLFIRRFRAGLKLEKINSIKEKEKRKGRLGKEEKIGGEDEGEHV